MHSSLHLLFIISPEFLAVKCLQQWKSLVAIQDPMSIKVGHPSLHGEWLAYENEWPGNGNTLISETDI